jgi:hypothetical protein
MRGTDVKKVTRGLRAATLDPEIFAGRLQIEFNKHWHLLEALVDLRLDGQVARSAVEALLDLPILRRLRTSWELWDCLVIGDGYDPDDLLVEYLDPRVLDTARDALWGPFELIEPF